MEMVELAYGVVLAAFSTWLIVFGTCNTLRQRGRLAALKEGVRSAFVFCPLTAVVFLHAGGIVWPNQLVWRVYAALLIIFIISRIASPVYRPYWNNLKEKYISWPFISSLLTLAFLLAVSPAVLILGSYAFK